MSVIEIKNLTFAYTGGTPVLHNISLDVSKGEIFVIAGPSGSGKTTLCNILCGVIPNAVKGDLSGQITVVDVDPRDAGLPQTSLRAGMVFQDAESQIICTTVEDELAFGLENLCRPPDEIRQRVDELIEEFGFTGKHDVNPANLSGGQKKLLTIAAVLATSPPVLILDEPMSSLDTEGRELVKNAIERQRRQGRTVIMVEHDLKPVAFADRWLLLRNGETAVCGAPFDILQDKELLKELRLA